MSTGRRIYVSANRVIGTGDTSPVFCRTCGT